MAIYNNVTGLETFNLESIHISKHLSTCILDQPAAQSPPATPSVTLQTPEPMQVDSFHLFHAERQLSYLSAMPSCEYYSTTSPVASLTRTTVSLTLSNSPFQCKPS